MSYNNLPPPEEFTEEELANDWCLQYFHYMHLPPHLKPTSKMFCEMAKQMVTTLPRNPERSVALRKLLESKDAAVRAMGSK
jgi:hypothetical protein